MTKEQTESLARLIESKCAELREKGFQNNTSARSAYACPRAFEEVKKIIESMQETIECSDGKDPAKDIEYLPGWRVCSCENHVHIFDHNVGSKMIINMDLAEKLLVVGIPCSRST